MNAKPALALVCLLTALLAGCAQPGTTTPNETNSASSTPSPPSSSLAPTSTGTDPSTPTSTSTTPTYALAVVFSAPTSLTIYQATAIINGTARDGPLSYKADADAGAGTFVRHGEAWSLTIDVAPGHTNVTINLEDGKVVRSRSLVVTRLVEGTVQVDFRGVPGHTNRNDVVWVDVDAHASAGYYTGQAVAHPAFANVHDLLVTWTNATGVPIVYKPNASFGQQLMQIDGVGDVTGNSSAFWCYQVNGSSSGVLGITAQEFHPGDVVSWSLGAVCP